MFKKLNITWGSDPEAFYARDGQIVGSERIIPENGYPAGPAGRVVRDGVQFELNPTAGSIPELGYYIGTLLNAAQRLGHVYESSTDFRGVVEVSRQELDALTPSSRVLGCMPSKNAYQERPILVDPATYRKRSAGGHIHVGISQHNDLMYERERLIPLFDVFVGNTCVLLDRDPGAAERRENYGRAGEYRLPAHGIEYRTISNFWLRDYALFEFVFGMAEVAVSALDEALRGRKSIMEETVKRIKIENVVKAIDTNNFDLAMENFLALTPVLQRNLPLGVFPLDKRNIQTFITFAEDVNRRGIEHYFPSHTIFDRWARQRKEGFGVFLQP